MLVGSGVAVLTWAKGSKISTCVTRKGSCVGVAVGGSCVFVGSGDTIVGVDVPVGSGDTAVGSGSSTGMNAQQRRARTTTPATTPDTIDSACFTRPLVINLLS